MSFNIERHIHTRVIFMKRMTCCLLGVQCYDKCVFLTERRKTDCECRQTKRREFRPVAQTEANFCEATTVKSLLWCVRTPQNELRGCPQRQVFLQCASFRIWPRWVRPESRERAVKNFPRQGVVIPLTTFTYTLKHTNHPRCQSRLWVLRNSDTIEARVHSRQNTKYVVWLMLLLLLRNK